MDIFALRQGVVSSVLGEAEQGILGAERLRGEASGALKGHQFWYPSHPTSVPLLRR